MNDNERDMLIKHLEWLRNDVIPGFQRSQQPPSWKAESIRRAEMQIDNIAWRLETGNAAPKCGWKGSYRSHPADCYYCLHGHMKPSGKPFARRDVVDEVDNPAVVTPNDPSTTPQSLQIP